MTTSWNDTEPIYIQLRDRVLDLILDGTLGDGDALPSVRQVAAEYQINPLTVLKAYQMLSDSGLVEKRRGRGMFICEGTENALRKEQRTHFIREEWPMILKKLEQLGLTLDDLPEKTGDAETQS